MTLLHMRYDLRMCGGSSGAGIVFLAPLFLVLTVNLLLGQPLKLRKQSFTSLNNIADAYLHAVYILLERIGFSAESKQPC
ncbi:hypothetical protein D3C73_1447480 [compost metagenome]